MRIAVLGAGNVGGALAKASVTAGHHVVSSADAANGWPWQSACKLVGPTGER